MDNKKQSKNTPFNFLRYLGPGLLVTVGFIDPGNWASNIAAGSGFGYQLLWMVTLSTFMLIVLQHNAAHLPIGSNQQIYAKSLEKYYPADCHDRSNCNRNGGDTRWSNCIGNVISYSN